MEFLCQRCLQERTWHVTPQFAIAKVVLFSEWNEVWRLCLNRSPFEASSSNNNNETNKKMPPLNSIFGTVTRKVTTKWLRQGKARRIQQEGSEQSWQGWSWNKPDGTANAVISVISNEQNEAGQEDIHLANSSRRLVGYHTQGKGRFCTVHEKLTEQWLRWNRWLKACKSDEQRNIWSSGFQWKEPVKLIRVLHAGKMLTAWFLYLVCETMDTLFSSVITVVSSKCGGEFGMLTGVQMGVRCRIQESQGNSSPWRNREKHERLWRLEGKAWPPWPLCSQRHSRKDVIQDSDIRRRSALHDWSPYIKGTVTNTLLPSRTHAEV